MRFKFYIVFFSLAIILIPFGAVFGGESGLEGVVTAKGQLVSVSGDEAKFNEYGDRTDGIYGNIELNHETERYFLKFNANDVTYDTQKYTLNGGMWGKFRYNIFYKEMPHNITFDARTFLSGVGGDKLTEAYDPDDVSTWHKFDYSTERRRYGAGLKFDMLHPFFIDIKVQREEKVGLKAGGGRYDIEVPEPVDYQTDSFSAEAGYSKKPFFASISYYHSKFENPNQLLRVTTIDTGQDATTLPPDNDYNRIGFKGAVVLPMNSRFSANIGIGEAKSDYKLVTREGDPCIDCSSQNFDGKIKTRNYDLVLTSHPISILDAKIFYKEYKKINESDEIDDGFFTNPLFSYKKTSYGAQLGSKLPQDLKLTAKYAHTETTYDERLDADKKKDDTYGIKLSWAGLDFLTANVGYERMNRRADTPSFDVSDVERYMGRFDVAPFDRDTYEVSFDVNPLENLNVSLGYKNKKTDYKDTVLGMTDDERDEFYVDANYMMNKMVTFFGYVDYEKVRSKQYQRNYSNSGLGPNPDAGQSASEYNWTVEQEEKNVNYGIGSDISAIPGKLTFTLQYDNFKSDGDADFAYLFAGALPVGETNSSIDISEWDDYRKQAVSVKAVYKVSDPLTVTAGYAYEQYKHSDALVDGYQYFEDGFYLSGAFKDQSYNSSVVYAAATYRF